MKLETQEIDLTKRSQKFAQARETLPTELRSIFDDLVSDYRFATVKHYRAGYVAYMALAELVKSGWRIK